MKGSFFLKVFIENVSLTALKCNLQSRKWFDEKELDFRLVAVYVAAEIDYL